MLLDKTSPKKYITRQNAIQIESNYVKDVKGQNATYRVRQQDYPCIHRQTHLTVHNQLSQERERDIPPIKRYVDNNTNN